MTDHKPIIYSLAKDFLLSLYRKIHQKPWLPHSRRLKPYTKRFYRAINSIDKHPYQLVQVLLATASSAEASHIYIEPTSHCCFQILFRINNRLERFAVFSSAINNRLLNEINTHTKSTRPGHLNVEEGHLDFHHKGKFKKFFVFFIPRDTINSITITTIPPASQNQHETKTFSRKRNIEKKIIIWQMGKVGSLSIYNSLCKYSIPTKWAHFSVFPDDRWPIHNNIIQTHSINLLYNMLHYSDEEFVIISLVRDLMARNISSVFQSMNFKEDWRDDYFIASKKEFLKFPFSKQEEEIKKQLSKINSDQSTFNWYDNLMRSHYYYPDVDKYFIDIYSKPFDQKKGYQTYQSNNKRINMIILRLEDLNNLAKTLGDFLDESQFKLIRSNISEKKWYNHIYKRFLSIYQPTEKDLEKIYSSKFMTYFYSETQRKQFMDYWRNNKTLERTSKSHR